ncbi:unnamed protein product [Camellia sinensis]
MFLSPSPQFRLWPSSDPLSLPSFTPFRCRHYVSAFYSATIASFSPSDLPLSFFRSVAFTLICSLPSSDSLSPVLGSYGFEGFLFCFSIFGVSLAYPHKWMYPMYLSQIYSSVKLL